MHTATTERTIRTGPRRRLDALAERVDAATPAHRDRVLDAVRVAAMLVVALGHWLMAVVHVGPEGDLAAGHLLAAAPATQWLTWALQVMGLFFAVGGWASAATLSRGPVDTAQWIHARVRRLALPATAYVATLAVAVPLLGRVVDADLVAVAGRFLTVHLWFVSVIALVYVLTPWLHRAWVDLGGRLLAGLTGAALVVDVAHRVLELPGVGWANFVLVWSAATVLGFAWHDGHLTPRVARLLVGGGLLVMSLLVASPWLPRSMVGVPGALQSNNSPPSTALLGLTALHVGVVVLASPWLRRLLARPRVWLAVVSASRVAVTVYLWHLLAMGLVVAGGLATSPSLLGDGTVDAGWWAQRPLWLVVLSLATAPLVALAVRFEQRPAPVATPDGVRVVVAALLVSLGCALLALHGVSSATGLLCVAAAALVGRWAPRSERP